MAQTSGNENEVFSDQNSRDRSYAYSGKHPRKKSSEGGAEQPKVVLREKGTNVTEWRFEETKYGSLADRASTISEDGVVARSGSTASVASVASVSSIASGTSANRNSRLDSVSEEKAPAISFNAGNSKQQAKLDNEAANLNEEGLLPRADGHSELKTNDQQTQAAELKLDSELDNDGNEETSHVTVGNLGEPEENPDNLVHLNDNILLPRSKSLDETKSKLDYSLATGLISSSEKDDTANQESSFAKFIDVAVPNAPRQRNIRLPSDTEELVTPVPESASQGDKHESAGSSNIFTMSEAEDYDHDPRLDPTLPLPEPTCTAEYSSDFKDVDATVLVGKDTRKFLPLEIPVENEDDVPQAVAETKLSSHTGKMIVSAVLPISVVIALRHRNSDLVPPVPLSMPLLRILSAFVTDVMEISSTLVSMRIPEIRAFLDHGLSESFHSEPFTIWTSADHDYRYGAKMVTYVNNAYLSIGFALMKGEHDDKVSWPFDKMVALKLMNRDDYNSKKRAFLCCVQTKKLTESLSRPTAGSNPPLGFLDFISTKELDDGFTERDSLTVIARFTSKTYELSSDVKLEQPDLLPE